MFKDIKSSNCWISTAKILKGWSTDEKYLITTKTGDKQLLRLSTIDKYEEKKKEYDIIAKYARTGINMSMPISFGICNENQNVYMILTWVEGQDLEEVLPTLSEKEQYHLGSLAGEILRKIHNIPVDKADVPNDTKKNKKLRQLLNYEKSNVRIPNDEFAIQYIYDNIDNIWQEKPVYQHGDFHPGNLIYLNDGSIGVIDFNRWEIGDPYEEFYKMESFAIEISIPFCIGQIETYFDGKIPNCFWITLAVYVAHASLYSIKWAEKFGARDIDEMTERCLVAFKDYNNFNLIIPTWYKKINIIKT